MTIFDQSYPPSLWAEEPEGLTAAPQSAPSYELPEDVEHFTVDAVKDWVGDDPAKAQAALDAEQVRGGDARVTLVDWLTAHSEAAQA